MPKEFRMWLDDKYWLNAARWVYRLADLYCRILTVEALQGLSPRCVPLEFSHILSLDQAYVIAMPKDDVDHLSLPWIRALRSFHVVDADDVFAIFTTKPISGVPELDPEIAAEKLSYLWDKVDRVISGREIRANRIDASLSTVKPGEPYCLLINACLTENVGDKLLASAAREIIERARPELGLVVADPDIDRTLIANAALVAIGPGGVLYDLHCDDELEINFQNIANYFRNGYIANEYGRPLCVIGLGRQSRFISRSTTKFVKGAIAEAMFLSLRDSETAQLIVKEFGFNNPIVVTPDCCVTFCDEIREIARRPTERRIVAICGNFDANALIEALGGCGSRVRIVLQALEDVSWFQRNEPLLRGGLPDLELADVHGGPKEGFLEAVASADALVTSRFHGMMVGLIAGIDTVVVGASNDKRQRVVKALKNRSRIEFIDAQETAEPFFRTAVASVANSGRRDPANAAFEKSDVYPIRDLLVWTAKTAPLIKTPVDCGNGPADQSAFVTISPKQVEGKPSTQSLI
jgi:exopolysaccharide biosynthesis predicted pyruvyltransferase EpsI